MVFGCISSVCFVLGLIQWGLFALIVYNKGPEVRRRAKSYFGKLLLYSSGGAGVGIFVLLEFVLILLYVNASPEEKAQKNFFVSSGVMLASSLLLGLFIGFMMIPLGMMSWGKAMPATPCETCGAKDGEILKLCEDCNKTVCPKCSRDRCKTCGNKELIAMRPV